MSKFLFLHISKCGGTSIKKMIKNKDNIENIERHHLDSLHLRLDRYNDYIKFTIVRDPYDRIKSVCRMVNERGYQTTIDEILDIVEDKDVSHYFQFFNTKNGYIKRHALPMTHKHYCVYDLESEKLIADKVYRFEDFGSIHKDLEELTGRNFELIKVNSTKKIGLVLSKDQIRRINKIYEKDFEVFNYNMEKV